MRKLKVDIQKNPDGTWSPNPALKGWALTRSIKALRYAVFDEAREHGWRLTDAGSCTMVRMVEKGVYDLVCLCPSISGDKTTPYDIHYARHYITPELLAEKDVQQLVYAYGYNSPKDPYISYGRPTADQIMAEILFMKEFCVLSPTGEDKVGEPVNALMALATMVGIDVFGNKPLTPSELRQIAGEPYWHKSLREKDLPAYWSILPEFVANRPETFHYGETWLAYRHKPE